MEEKQIYSPLKEQDLVIKAAQVGLALLSDERSSTPNNMIEGALTLKSLLQALIQGQLAICAKVPQVDPVPVTEAEAA